MNAGGSIRHRDRIEAHLGDDASSWTINEADISARTLPLADFIEAASARYSLTRAPIAIGFSDGAITAAALLLMQPSLLAGAILLRPPASFRDDLPTRARGSRC
jgi:phospholipase/carboxylesterase